MTPAAGAGGSTFAFAAGPGRAVYAWGDNRHSQLGNGTTQGVLVPTLIPLPAGVAAAALVPESGSTSAYLITAPGGRNGR
jgi:alpha-tubulin suppressor-like RCC1 family protein